MSDLIDREALLRQIDIDSEGEPGYYGDTWKFIDTIKSMPPAELSTNLASLGTDCISRQAAISAICNACGKIDCDKMDKCEKLQLPPANNSEIPNSSDTISRQAAIKALDKRFDSIPMEQTTAILLLRRDLRELPTAQPEPCEDAVSREKVKELAYSQIRSEYSGIALKEQRESMLRIADNVIGLLPSVTPKQRTGKWINGYCSECGEHAPFWAMASTYHESNFCPHCGAKMEVTT